MVLEQRSPLGDSDEGDADLGSMLVQGLLSLHADGVGALIQHPECGLPEEQACQAYALLLPCNPAASSLCARIVELMARSVWTPVALRARPKQHKGHGV